jgi:tRNA(Ile)-lysidine synthase
VVGEGAQTSGRLAKTRERQYNSRTMRAVETLVERTARTMEERDLLRGCRRLGVAVSGGADSVCLLYLLLELAPRWDLELTVLHLDHCLRGEESRGDAEFVHGLADDLGLPFVLRTVDLGDRQENLEQAARKARLEFFAGEIDGGTVELVATGHTRSDQAETVLFRFLRGAGTAGLAGIRWRVAPGIVRPLLQTDRAEVESFLRERGIAWREDSTNASLSFARNRLRHGLLPQLAREWNPAIAAILANTAEWAVEEEAWWGEEIGRLAAGNLELREGAATLRTDFLTRLPVAVGRRMVRHAMATVRGDLRGIDFEHVEEVLRLARKPAGSGHCRVPELDICRSFNWLRFALYKENGRAPVGYFVPVAAPGTYTGPGGWPSICLELIEKSETSGAPECVYNGEMGCLDWGRLSGSLVLRNWKPGDRYQPTGRTAVEKIRTLFQKARIPLWERRSWPVLTDGVSILWSRKFGPAAELAAGSSTETILRIREVSQN